MRELDFGGVLVDGMFEPLREPAVFSQVAVDEIAGTIGWPNGIDFDPDVNHGDHDPAGGRSPTTIREYRLRATG